MQNVKVYVVEVCLETEAVRILYKRTNRILLSESAGGLFEKIGLTAQLVLRERVQLLDDHSFGGKQAKDLSREILRLRTAGWWGVIPLGMTQKRRVLRVRFFLCLRTLWMMGV